LRNDDGRGGWFKGRSLRAHARTDEDFGKLSRDVSGGTGLETDVVQRVTLRSHSIMWMGSDGIIADDVGYDPTISPNQKI
jgi:hypothetical protein